MNKLVRLVRPVRIITPKNVQDDIQVYFFSLFSARRVDVWYTFSIYERRWPAGVSEATRCTRRVIFRFCSSFRGKDRLNMN